MSANLVLHEAKDQLGENNKWCVYILECSDGKLYTGITKNFNNRIKQHNSGHGCKFTRCRTPVKLLYKKSAGSIEKALRQELKIKGLTREKKFELISQY